MIYFFSLKVGSIKPWQPNSNSAKPSDVKLLQLFLKAGQDQKIEGCELLNTFQDGFTSKEQQMSLHYLIWKQKQKSPSDFLVSITKEIIEGVEKSTRGQNSSDLWHELRYGRITASKAYEVSRCQTVDGTLVSQIMGGKVPDTAAMRHGRDTEDSVRQVVSEILNIRFQKCGLF